MTKRVQILGHNFEDANAFLGEDRELTVDTDNKDLRVHDGTTPGGWRILNRDSNDARYQARSVELDGLLGWEPNERGSVTRLGPANYALRLTIGNPDNITVVNTDGYAGDIGISLADEIVSDHLASGVWTFANPIVGNMTGDTTGTHTGNVVGNVTGNVTGNLTGNANGNHTGSFTGHLDTRGSDVYMDDGTIQLSWLAPEILDYIVAAGTPVGSCVPYYGDFGDIPANWYVCDGTNGTPNLTDRFIVGAGPTYTADSTGGAATHTHGVTIDSGGAHTHTGSNSAESLSIAQMPAHNHGNGVTDVGTDLFCYGNKAASVSTPDSIDNNGNAGVNQGLTETIGGGATHTHTLTVDSGGAHVHTGTTVAAPTLPPYYSMIYIMKGA